MWLALLRWPGNKLAVSPVNGHVVEETFANWDLSLHRHESTAHTLSLMWDRSPLLCLKAYTAKTPEVKRSWRGLTQCPARELPSCKKEVPTRQSSIPLQLLGWETAQLTRLLQFAFVGDFHAACHDITDQLKHHR